MNSGVQVLLPMFSDYRNFKQITNVPTLTSLA